MTIMSQIGFALIALLVGWMLYRGIRHQKGLFTKENFSKTATTMGILALILIAFIWVAVFFLRQT